MVDRCRLREHLIWEEPRWWVGTPYRRERTPAEARALIPAEFLARWRSDPREPSRFLGCPSFLLQPQVERKESERML